MSHRDEERTKGTVSLLPPSSAGPPPKSAPNPNSPDPDRDGIAGLFNDDIIESAHSTAVSIHKGW